MPPPTARLSIDDPSYPERLRVLSDPPPTLDVAGRLPSAAAEAVAIVGSRRASEDGRRRARGLARALASQGLVVVSGGALGIDAEAHFGALEAGGPTVVVLPTPVASPHPIRHRPLFESILARGGALISEQLEPVRGRSSFRARNRIIAALADLVVVVEAAARSGTRYTVEAAETQGKPVVFMPLAHAPASATRVCDVAEVLELLGRPRPAATPPAADLVGQVHRGPLTADELAACLNQPIAAVLRQLAELEIEGTVRKTSGGRYECRRPSSDAHLGFLRP